MHAKYMLVPRSVPVFSWIDPKFKPKLGLVDFSSPVTTNSYSRENLKINPEQGGTKAPPIRVQTLITLATKLESLRCWRFGSSLVPSFSWLIFKLKSNLWTCRIFKSGDYKFKFGLDPELENQSNIRRIHQSETYEKCLKTFRHI